MATGVAHDPGGVASPADVVGAGASQWEMLTGVSAMSPLVGGPGIQGAGGSQLPYNVDGAHSRIVSNGADPVSADPTHGVLDDWRDVFNFRGSPAPWLLLLILVILGFMQLRVSARAGGRSANVAIG